MEMRWYGTATEVRGWDDDGHDDMAVVISSRSVTRAQAEASGAAT